MKKLNILKKIIAVTVCASFAAATFFSCSNDTAAAENTAVLTLDAAGTARSVLPAVELADLTTLTLTGTPSGGTATELGSWTSYSGMTASTVAVSTGTWS